MDMFEKGYPAYLREPLIDRYQRNRVTQFGWFRDPLALYLTILQCSKTILTC